MTTVTTVKLTQRANRTVIYLKQYFGTNQPSSGLRKRNYKMELHYYINGNSRNRQLFKTRRGENDVEYHAIATLTGSVK